MTLLNTAQIPQRYSQAVALQAKGKVEDALSIYSEILAVKADIAEVHYQVGKIFFGGHKYTDSAYHLEIASQIKPNEPAIWNDFINSLLCTADGDVIKAASKRLKKTAMNKSAMINLSTRLLNTASKSTIKINSVEKQAIEAVQAALATGNTANANLLAKGFYTQHKNSAAITELLARTYAIVYDYGNARDYFRKALALEPKFFNAAKNFAQSELDAGEHKNAATLFGTAIQLAPRASSAFIGLARALKHMNMSAEANAILANANALMLRDAAIHRELGLVAFANGAHVDAVSHLTKAQKHGDKSAQLCIELGSAYIAIRDFDAAWAQYQSALKTEPNNHAAYYRQALALQEFADFDGAKENIQRAMELAPVETNYMLVYSNMQKFEKGDPFIDALIARHSDPKTSIDERTELGFAVTKVLEDSGQYDRVFAYLKSANDDMRKRFPYDVKSFETEMDHVCDYFSDFKLLNFKGMGDPDAKPIFVCGMPRSGTTLVEQIISSHSRVSGAGEVGFASQAEARMLTNTDGSLIPLLELGKQELSSLGREVDEHLASLFDNPDRVSDKSIQTYKRMGLLKAAMPNCKIIVVRRDPRDNLLSIYRNKFVDGTHLYAYDLSDLGKYYKQFVRIIDFWREKMPEGFMEIQYEDLIDDPEKHARALIDYCDLEWQDDCLNFHKSKRQVKTLSVYQVRQPIYKSSVKAWQRYEDDLQPLFEALK